MDAVLFDMDGVIVDTMDLHFEAGAKMLSKKGLKITKEELRKHDSRRFNDVYKDFFDSKNDAEIEAMLDEKYRWLKSRTKGIVPIPGFFEFFFKVKGKYPLAIVSSSRKHFVEHILKEIGEQDSFDIIVGGDQVSKGKPDPEGYLKAASLLGVQPEKCLVIEDSINGIISAKKSGAKCVAVTTTYEKNFLLDADLIVNSLTNLTIEKADGLFDA